MKIGRLDKYLELQRIAAEATDAIGQVSPAWGRVVARVPVEYAPGKGREYFAAKELAAEEVAAFRIRYVEGVTATTHRVLFQDRVWNIVSVEEFGRKEALWLYCTTGVVAEVA